MPEVMERAAGGATMVTPERKSARKLKLTRREFEVIALISQGYASKDAADILFISKRTVDFHLANIYDKVEGVVGCDGNRNRLWAIRWIKKFGLLPFEPSDTAWS